ncbi:hypothetical protein CBS101457_003412 [Exobasidium rhododendri]|nr:hypothetical protein CBS101457_003412 [Exobasidium rhododendri]
MVSTWLQKASTALICAVAMSGVVLSMPSMHPSSIQEAVEEMHFDKLGNMIWPSEEKPALGRPNFDSLNVQAFESEAVKQSEMWLGKAQEQGEALMEMVQHSVEDILHNLEESLESAKDKVAELQGGAQGWLHKGQVVVDGIEYEKLIHPHFPKHALRLSSKASKGMTSCDPDVKSYSGYLDIDSDKHLWFAFFESRSRKAAVDKTKEPIVMWLNGGPGCSSTTGWLMEKIGPCSIASNGTSVKYNEHSWTNEASVFFLDQPVSVGYSYTDGDDVNNTPQGAEDVYAFLQLFFARFDEYASSPFSIAAESYGGRYAPLYASKVFTENKKIASRGSVSNVMAPKTINLDTIMIGNGLTDPLIQFPLTANYLCDAKYGLFKEGSEECSTLESKAKTCSNLISNCYKYDSRLTCLPAALYCWSGLYSDAQKSGRNLYDLRKKCDRDPDADGPLCYRDETYVESYLNRPEIKEMFGVPEKVKFQACNMNVNQGFMFQGDSMHDSALVLPEMIEDGVRLLVYAGEYDAMCNWMGNVGDGSWPLQLDTSFQGELASANKTKWLVDGKKAGWVRQSGKGAGSITLVKVANAGHMVPYDQPVAALAMVNAWLANKSIA